MSARAEAAFWLQAAATLDDRRGAYLFAMPKELLGDRPLALDAIARLRAYDDPNWTYGPDDDYANMDADDAVMAALWLWRECVAAASAAQHGSRSLPGDER